MYWYFVQLLMYIATVFKPNSDRVTHKQGDFRDCTESNWDDCTESNCDACTESNCDDCTESN